MRSFTLTIGFSLLGSLTIKENQAWFICTAGNNFPDSFFDWIEARKYIPGASIEYNEGDVSGSDLYIITKYLKVLRFRFSGNENDGFYYQQRFNATENDNVQTLRDFIGDIEDTCFRKLASRFGLDLLLDEKINMLSTGEFRRAVILKAGMSSPRVIFVDEPYAGLDASGCQVFNEMVSHLICRGTSVVIFSSSCEKPAFITHSINSGKHRDSIYTYGPSRFTIPQIKYKIDFEYAFRLNNITARYSGRDILHNISWSVKPNQLWSLTGRNGAGKSTLLSFVYADNPQVYSNDVWLFDRKRGSGESIWEVKDMIGFYSSEMHRYFSKMKTVQAAIDSIVFQNPYEGRILSPEEENFMLQVTEYFGLGSLRQKFLYEISSVTQKLVLLAGVLAKNAPVLILDEPFQGFSDEMIERALALLVRYIRNRTFIMVSHSHSHFPEGVNKHFHLEEGVGNEIPGFPDTLGH